MFHVEHMTNGPWEKLDIGEQIPQMFHVEHFAKIDSLTTYPLGYVRMIVWMPIKIGAL
jgi:hypothetical protein